jgi:hypothetical protein
MKNRILIISFHLPRKLFFWLVLFTSTLIHAQINTKKLIPGESPQGSNNFVYALPLLKIQVDVWIEKTDHLRGPYASYANELLGLNEVVENNYSTYKIKEIKLKAVYLPDPKQFYSMQLDNLSGKSEISKYIEMTESGLLMGLSSKTTEESNAKTTVFEQVIMGTRDFKYYADANKIEKVDTIIRRVDIDTTTIVKTTLKRFSVEKDMASRAQDAATQLMEIRKNRLELISGFQEVPYSSGALNIMNDELKQMEDDYLSLFAGKELKSDQRYVFYYTPDGDQWNFEAPIFKFSKDSGLSDLNAVSGENVRLAIKSSGLNTQLSDLVTSSIIRGIVYRIPETAEVWIQYKNKEYNKQMMSVPQLGKLHFIEINENSFQLYPKTGGIKMLEIKE